LLDEDRRALEAVQTQAAAIARGAALLARTLEHDGRVIMAGAGTSGRLGVIEAAECPPTFGLRPSVIEAVMAGGRGAVFRSKEGAEDDERAGGRVGSRLRPGDLLIGISASSVTPFVRGALAAARKRGAGTILVTCARSAPSSGTADIVIRVATGPEVLTGSTRLKAGSATKAVLNALTTAAMVRRAKVYENLMVDLRLTSRKLKDRARRIVAALGGVGESRAQLLLRAAKGEVKVAILMARLQLPARDARRRLQDAGSNLRRALGRRRG